MYETKGGREGASKSARTEVASNWIYRERDISIRSYRICFELMETTTRHAAFTHSHPLIVSRAVCNFYRDYNETAVES